MYASCGMAFIVTNLPGCGNVTGAVAPRTFCENYRWRARMFDNFVN